MQQQQQKVIKTNGYSRQSPDVSSFKENEKEEMRREKTTRNESRKTHRLWLMPYGI